jgi:hypothetical protein
MGKDDRLAVAFERHFAHPGQLAAGCIARCLISQALPLP